MTNLPLTRSSLPYEVREVLEVQLLLHDRAVGEREAMNELKVVRFDHVQVHQEVRELPHRRVVHIVHGAKYGGPHTALPTLLGAQQLQTLLVHLVQSQEHVAVRLLPVLGVTGKEHSRHVALVAVHRHAAINHHILQFTHPPLIHLSRVHDGVVKRILDVLAVGAARHHRGERNALRATDLDVVLENGAEAILNPDDYA